MSGGHWNHVGFRLQDELDTIAADPYVREHWLRIALMLERLGPLLYDLEHEMDYHLSGDSHIPDGPAFEEQFIAGLRAIADAFPATMPGTPAPPPGWHGLVKVQRQLNESRHTVLIRSENGKVFRMFPINEQLAARFADRVLFYARATIRDPDLHGYGGLIDGALELGDEVDPADWKQE